MHEKLHKLLFERRDKFHRHVVRHLGPGLAKGLGSLYPSGKSRIKRLAYVAAKSLPFLPGSVEFVGCRLNSNQLALRPNFVDLILDFLDFFWIIVPERLALLLIEDFELEFVLLRF